MARKIRNITFPVSMAESTLVSLQREAASHNMSLAEMLEYVLECYAEQSDQAQDAYDSVGKFAELLAKLKPNATNRPFSQATVEKYADYNADGWGPETKADVPPLGTPHPVYGQNLNPKNCVPPAPIHYVLDPGQRIIAPALLALPEDFVMAHLEHPVRVENVTCGRCKSQEIWTEVAPTPGGAIPLRCRFCGADCGRIEPTKAQAKQQAQQPQANAGQLPKPAAGNSGSLNIKAPQTGLNLSPDAHNTLPLSSNTIPDEPNEWPNCPACGQPHGSSPCGMPAHSPGNPNPAPTTPDNFKSNPHSPASSG